MKSKEEATCEETEGAVHTYKEEVREVEVKASDNWTLSVSDLPKYNEYGNEYTYYVMETSPNSGYAVTYTGQDSGLQAGGRVTINNKKLPPIDLKIIKIDETTRDGTQQKLGAAEFTLYSNTGTTDTSYTVYTDGVKTTSTAEDETYGTLTFEDLPDGQYKIVETGQPDGYVKNEANDIYFDIAGGVLTRYDKAYGEEGRQKISPESEIADITYSMEGNTNAVFTVGNTPGAALPSTGGPGTGMNYLLAVNLIGLAGVGFVIKKRWRDPA